MSAAIRVELPRHLQTLAGVRGEVVVPVERAPTLRAVLVSLEAMYPMLGGTIRDHGTGERRPFLRFFVCEEDWSHHGLDAVLPDIVARGQEPLLIIGAVAGGAL